MQLVRLASALVVALVAVAVIGGGATSAGSPNQDVRYEVLAPIAQAVGGPINASVRSTAARSQHQVPLRTGNRPGGGGGGATDGAPQTTTSASISDAATGAPLLRTFDGVGVGLGGYRDCCAPPDPNLSVGTTQVVQWVNLDWAVWSKSGSLLGGPFPGNKVWSDNGFTAGNCASNNDGDPIVKFDAQAGRWVMTQFSVSGGPPYYQCVAVSQTADILSTGWVLAVYAFNNEFPDYPKLGVWPDGYYMSFNLFLNGQSFDGARACALDRSSLLAAQSASMLCATLPSFGSLLPSDLDGATGANGTTLAPATGRPNFFLNFGSNSLNVWQFQVTSFANAQFSFNGPTTLSVPAFQSACGGGACVPQLNTGQKLDSLADRLMYRLAYRNFGDHESLVVTHSVSGPNGTAAPRWYELRATPSGGSFGVFQRSSYAPDSTYRWMGSAAMDKAGDLAIGYSASSKAIFPAIRYTGRAAADPQNTLRAEASIQLGQGAQSGFGLTRWGDYTSITVDPFDDCTFWYTNEYLKSTGAFNWSTKIAAFKFAGCN